MNKKTVELGKTAVVGAGAVGLFYGGKLAAHEADVHFLMRAGLQEAQANGICIYSAKNEQIRIEHPKIAREARDIGPCDLVIVALKATANEALETLLPPLLHNETMLLTLQNGLGNEEYLAHRYGADRVLGGVCFVRLTRRTAASVDHFGHGMLSIGEFARPSRPRTRLIVDAFRESTIDAKLVEDLTTERWRKLAWNIPFNGLAVAEGGLSVDKILADPRHNARCRALMQETISAATALGCPIEKEYANVLIERTYPMGDYQPSTMVDWLAGKQLEIEAIWGEPLKRARKAGLALPNLEWLYERLKVVEGTKLRKE